MKAFSEVPRVPPLYATWRVSRDALGALEEFQRDHGDVVCVPIPGSPTVMLTDPRDIHAVLVRDFRKYQKDWYTRQLAPVAAEGLLLTEGDTWRRHRRLAQPAFAPEALASYAATMVEVADQTAAGWSPGSTIDLHAEMMHLTLRIVTRTLFGAEVDSATVGRALDVLMDTYRGVGNTGVVLPLWVPSPQNLRFRRSMTTMDQLLYGLIDAARREGRSDTLLGLLLAARDEAGGLTDRELHDELQTLLIAGHETTGLTLLYAGYLLSQDPAAEEQLHAELDAVLGGRPPALSDLASLPYTRGVVLESMRLFPPAWSIGREALEDVEIGGYSIPAGTHLWMLQWVVHRDPRWFAEPTRFRPERWAHGGLEKQLPDGAFFPFGLGPRICIGKRFAEMEATLALAALARSWSLRLAPGEELRLSPSITLRPERGLRMTAHPRRRRAAA